MIAGIGNVLLQDDGFGPHAIAHLESEYEFESDVELLDLGTPALDFIDYLVDRELVILLDALSCGGGPGEVLVYDQAQLRQHLPGMRLSAHQPCLEETLFAAETAGVALKEVWLVGVVGLNFDVGTELGPDVGRAVPKALALVCEMLSLRDVKVRRRAKPLPQRAWWARGAILASLD